MMMKPSSGVLSLVSLSKLKWAVYTVLFLSFLAAVLTIVNLIQLPTDNLISLATEHFYNFFLAVINIFALGVILYLTHILNSLLVERRDIQKLIKNMHVSK